MMCNFKSFRFSYLFSFVGFLLGFIQTTCCLTRSCSSSSGCNGESKLTFIDNGPCTDKDKPFALARHNPVKVGYVQEIDLGRLGKRFMITKAIRPPIFEIPDFLTGKECEHIIELASEQGLENSVAKGGLTPKRIPVLPDNVTGSIKPNELGGQFEHWDRDKDGVISLLEIGNFARKKRLLYLTQDDIVAMIAKLNITEAEDGKITREEFQTTNTFGMDSYFYKLNRLHPKHRDRFSEQTWLRFGRRADKTMSRILKRVVKLTKLPSELVYGGEEMQVVRYQPYGHYHAHYDSETHKRKEVRCCHQVFPGRKCKLCRYITVLYYLNDDFTGGETAFPLADNATMDMSSSKYWLKRSAKASRSEVSFPESRKLAVIGRIKGMECVARFSRPWWGINLAITREDKDMFNLNEHCQTANLVVKPKKRGTALLWYNHEVDYKNGGWLGDLDNYSLHGGCMVKEGQKWIANNWLTAPYHIGKDTPSIFLNRFEAFKVH